MRTCTRIAPHLSGSGWIQGRAAILGPDGIFGGVPGNEHGQRMAEYKVRPLRTLQPLADRSLIRSQTEQRRLRGDILRFVATCCTRCDPELIIDRSAETEWRRWSERQSFCARLSQVGDEWLELDRSVHPLDDDEFSLDTIESAQ